MLPTLQNAASQIGKWRYFLTGLSLVVLVGLVCQAIGRLMTPLQAWRKFHGTCTEVIQTGTQSILCVQFQDAKQLSHSAAFRTEHASAAALHTGDPVAFAIRTDTFTAGCYADTAEAAAQNDGKILLRAEHRALLSQTLLRMLLRELIRCGIAFAVFLLAMKVCFP